MEKERKGMDKNKDIEKIRDNPNKENLKNFLDGITEEAKNRGHIGKDFMDGVRFAVWMIKHFFKIK